jgi:hypothetical protein
VNVRRGPLNTQESDENRELYKQLWERVKQLRMRELFEEPSTYEDELDDDDHIW